MSLTHCSLDKSWRSLIQLSIHSFLYPTNIYPVPTVAMNKTVLMPDFNVLLFLTLFFFSNSVSKLSLSLSVLPASEANSNFISLWRSFWFLHCKRMAMNFNQLSTSVMHFSGHSHSQLLSSQIPAYQLMTSSRTSQRKKKQGDNNLLFH